MASKALSKIDVQFTTGETPDAWGQAARTVYNGVSSTNPDFLTKHEDRVDFMLETMVDKVNLEKRGRDVVATSVEIVDKAKERSVVKAKKEVIIFGAEARWAVASSAGGRGHLLRTGDCAALRCGTES